MILFGVLDQALSCQHLNEPMLTCTRFLLLMNSIFIESHTQSAFFCQLYPPSPLRQGLIQIEMMGVILTYKCMVALIFFNFESQRVEGACYHLFETLFSILHKIHQPPIRFCSYAINQTTPYTPYVQQHTGGMPFLVHKMWNCVVMSLAENGRKIRDEPGSILSPIL